MNFGQMSLNGGFSICVWYYFDYVTLWGRIFDFGLGTCNNNLILGRYINSNTLELGIFHDASCNKESLFSPVPIATGVWRHTCVVNQEKTWRLYDDGVLTATLTSAFNLQSVNLTSNFLGRSNWSPDRLFRGKIDEFRWYSRVLTSSEVANIYLFRGMACPNIVLEVTILVCKFCKAVTILEFQWIVC
jgi:hypothetical protein